MSAHENMLDSTDRRLTPDGAGSSSGGVALDTLEVGDLRIVVNRIGAEMISLARRDAQGRWQGFLYRDGEAGPPSSGWANHATVMGYFLHRLWKGESNYRGTILRGGTHGFLRHFAFDAPEVRNNRLTYRVPSARIPSDAYPLRVSLALSYTLSPGGLRVEFSLMNEEAEAEAHVSFGLHPGFAISSWRTARFLMPPGSYKRLLAPGNFLDGRTEEIVFPGGGMPFAVQDLPGSFLLDLEGVPKRLFRLEDPDSGREVALDFSEVPYLTLWSEGGPFLCIEPCWGLPDANPPTAFEDKPGIQRIPAGRTFTRGLEIRPGFSECGKRACS